MDARGYRTRVVEDTGRQVDYIYDALGRLVEETLNDLAAGSREIDYQYDPAGNRLSRNDSVEGLTTYAYDENDRLLVETLATDITRYTYDGNGNQLSKITNATDSVFYRWDSQNRLKDADTDGDHTPDVSYEYDASGNRVSQTAGGEETRFLIDANGRLARVIEEYTPGGVIKSSYVYGNRLISQNRAGAKSYYHVDGLGSTRALTSPDATVTDRYTYDAFGRVVAQVGTTPNSYLFAGEQWDANVEQLYLRARYYDLATGRFISRDAFPGFDSRPLSLHKYLYAESNPVNYTDPSGEFSLIELVTTMAQQVWQKGQSAWRAYRGLERTREVALEVMQLTGSALSFAAGVAAFSAPDYAGLFFGGMYGWLARGLAAKAAGNLPANSGQINVAAFGESLTRTSGQAGGIGLMWLALNMAFRKIDYRTDLDVLGPSAKDAAAAVVRVGNEPSWSYFVSEKQFSAGNSPLSLKGTIFLGLSFWTLPPLPYSPIARSMVTTLVHEFVHVAIGPPDIAYDYAALLLPPPASWVNPDNYRIAVAILGAGLRPPTLVTALTGQR